MHAPVIDSRASFQRALAWGFQAAIAHGARRIVCSDESFADWSLDDAATLQALSGWLRLPQRRLEMLARSYDDVPRRHPRFNAWRRDWTHAIGCMQPPEDWSSALPGVLVSDTGVSVHLIDAVHWRGRTSLDARDARPWLETCDVVLQRSSPAFAVNVLGL